jgi:hypothetical protein
MANEAGEQAMAIIDILKLIKFDELDKDQKNELRKRFRESKKELEAAMRAVDKGLDALSEKSKPKSKR